MWWIATSFLFLITSGFVMRLQNLVEWEFEFFLLVAKHVKWQALDSFSDSYSFSFSHMGVGIVCVLNGVTCLVFISSTLGCWHAFVVRVYLW